MNIAGPCEPYLRLRRRYFLLFFSFPALLGVISLLANYAKPYLPGPVYGVAMIAGGIALVTIWVKALVTWFRILRWPCPLCGKSFVFAWWSTIPTNYCQHCGFRADEST